MNRNNSYLIGNQFAKGNPPNKTVFKKGVYLGFGFKKGNELWRKRKNKPIGMLGKHHSLKTKLLLSKVLKGKCDGKANAIKGRLKISESKMGCKNPMWKGGITPINKLIRRSRKYRHFAQKIFIRDNFICKECRQKGGRLEIHHIKPFSVYIELRFNENNVITLCKKCHGKTENYGRPKQKR